MRKIVSKIPWLAFVLGTLLAPQLSFGGPCSDAAPQIVTDWWLAQGTRTHCCCYKNKAGAGPPVSDPPVNQGLPCTDPCNGSGTCTKHYVDSTWPITVEVHEDNCFQKDPLTGEYVHGASIIRKTRVYYCRCSNLEAECNNLMEVILTVPTYSCLDCPPPLSPPNPNC